MNRKSGLLMLGLVWCLGMGPAEAGVGTTLKNLWTYSVSPVNCLLNFGTSLVADVAEFGRCFIANLNRNPANLQRLTSYLPTEGP